MAARVALALVLAAALARADITTGLLVHWSFEGSWADSGSSHNAAKPVNGATLTPACSAAGGCATVSADEKGFIATSDVVKLPTPAMSVAMWVRPSNRTFVSPLPTREILYLSGSVINKELWQAEGASFAGTDVAGKDGAFADGRWTHVALTLFSNPMGSLSYWVNGELVRNMRMGVQPGPSTIKPFFGQDQAGSHGGFDGDYDEVRVYSRCLTLDDVTELIKSSPHP
eukprot:m51a1_g3771 hypothetical protein (228) ;mRNA; r:139612-140295